MDTGEVGEEEWHGIHVTETCEEMDLSLRDGMGGLPIRLDEGIIY